LRNALGLQGHCWCLEVSIGGLKIAVVLPLMTLYNRLLIVDQKYSVVLPLMTLYNRLFITGLSFLSGLK
jgi:hypothetical protein